MVEVFLNTDSRYQIDRQFVKEYLQKIWAEKSLPDGALSIAFVGARKAKSLAKKYLHEDQEHPVLTFPYLTKDFKLPPQTGGGAFLGEIIICYPQVTLHAAENNREINKVIAIFLDHAATILKQENK